jgi:cysteine desulfurase / selenocysteine lyase
VISLDNASTAHPRPPEVLAEMTRAMADASGCPFPPEPGAGRQAARILEDVRLEAAALLGAADPARVVLTASGTDALSGALRGVLQRGDHIVTTDLEHDAVARPLRHMQMRGEIALTRVEGGREGRIDPAELQRACGHRTKLLVVTHGSNVLGTVQPIEEIARLARARGVPVLVDASHTAGIVPIDVDSWGIDFLACSGHKGLFGPAGTGLLVIASGRRLRPWREGETGGDAAASTQPGDLPWSLEAGFPNVVGLAGLAAGIRFVRRETPARLGEHQTNLIRRFIGALGLDERFRLLAARGDAPRTGTVSLLLPGVPPLDVARLLEERAGIVVRAGLHGAGGVHVALGTHPAGTVRVSAGCFTTEEEIDRTVAALREIADERVEGTRGRARTHHAGPAAARGAGGP